MTSELPMAGPTSVGTALAQATVALAHLPDPGGEARALLAALTGNSRSRLLAFPETLLTAEQAARLPVWIDRRADGEPLAYLSGWRGFRTLELLITPAVLVPRPETELLVDLALARLSEMPPGQRPLCVDLGTGSGAIALACARARPDTYWLATDRCRRALAVARANAERLGIDNLRLLGSHWWRGFGAARLDLIVSNPPYIAVGDPALAGDGLCHEPAAALVSGADGLADLAEIILGASAYLAPGGWLLLEHGATQGEDVRERLRGAGFVEVASFPDLAGLPRVSLGRQPGTAASRATMAAD